MGRMTRNISIVSPTAAQAIRRAIDAQGRKVEWVAVELGIPRGTLSPMLTGANPLRPDVAERAALLLGIPRSLVLDSAEQTPA